MAKTEGLMLTATTDIMSYSYSGDEHYYDDYYSSNITDERCNKEAVIQFGAIFTPVFFSIVVIFSLFGNILIIVILAKYENFRSLTNTFILNLAISDLFFTAGLPFWAYYHMYGWDLGEVACKTVSFVFYIGFYSSGILLILMTAHRYVAVMNPLSNIVSATGGSSVITSVIIWAKFTMMENLTMAYEDDSMVYLCDRTFDFYTISSVFFILIFIFSVTGNCLILCVLVIYENLKNVTNIFILNVACSDLIFALTLPFWAVYYLHHWVFGDFTCKFMTAAHFIGLYSSVILLTAMTVDRFTTVVLQNWPNNRLKRQRCAKGACAAAWIISIAASLSNAISVKVETFQDNFTTCEASSEGSVVKLGNFLQVSLLFFLPLAIIVFCYSAIVKTVLQSSNRKWHRTLVVVFCIVAAFFICWGPYNMMILFSSFEPDECKAAERWEIAFRISLHHHHNLLLSGGQFLAPIPSRKPSWVARLCAVKNVRPSVPPPRLCRAIFKGSKHIVLHILPLLSLPPFAILPHPSIPSPISPGGADGCGAH
ncbi:hypothetical protein Q8A73_015310 [Channa argus]|nr:hypothetical protein Q8A73_015310 [Channa argus]